jgi:hypothetical protein
MIAARSTPNNIIGLIEAPIYILGGIILGGGIAITSNLVFGSRKSEAKYDLLRKMDLKYYKSDNPTSLQLGITQNGLGLICKF